MTASLIAVPEPRIGVLRRRHDLDVPPDPVCAALDQRARRLASRFADWYGGPPAAMTAAPATVDLLGGPSWWDGGPRLAAAVDRSALVAVDVGPGGDVGVLTDRDFPVGAGLGSRTAERVALRTSLERLHHPDRLEWTGRELASRWGRPGTALVVDGDTAEPVPVGLEHFSLLVVDTGLRHLGRDSALRDRNRALGRVTADAAPTSDLEVRCLRHAMGERSRVAAAVPLLTAGDGVAVGQLMTASHESSSRDLRTTTVQVDATVDAVLRAGAAGARMIGAGFGGAVLTLVPRGLEDRVREAATAAALTDGFPRPRVVPLLLTGRVRRIRDHAEPRTE